MASQTQIEYTSLLKDNLHSFFSIDLDTSFFMTQFRFPMIGVMLYLLLIHYFQPSKDIVNTNKNHQQKKERKFGRIEKFMFFHNMLLCIFSLACFLNTAPIVYELFQQYTWRDVVCYKFSLEYEKTYGYWSHLFYLSKFYEFIDTFIVVAKGRRPITLQVFHHCGAVFGMWLLHVTRCSGGYLFVVENSFIHTIMYFYYAVSLLGIEWKNKFILTILQMIQFVAGTGVGLYQVYTFNDCIRFEDKYAVLLNAVYTNALFIMFAKFYNQSYIKPKKKQL